MLCENPACRKEVPADAFFCTWCARYAGGAAVGTKASLFARFVALLVDPLIGIVLWLLASSMFGAVSSDAGWVIAFLFPLAYTVVYFILLRHGRTPGKAALGLQVVNQRTGGIPGFWRMVLREVLGRILSGLFFGLGYLWALFDKNGQAWHDKLAGTVVVKRAAPPSVQSAVRSQAASN